MRILVVEDEHKIANSIKKGLEQEKYAVDVAYTGQDGFDLAVSEDYDLLILDRMLPEIDGIEIVKGVRKSTKNPNLPIILLTAKGQISDKIEGLDSGADDYLVKPFAFTELLARIRALIRRPKISVGSILKVENLILNISSFEVKRSGIKITLSNKEFSLLEYLMRNKGKIIKKDQIINHVWSYDADVLPNSVEVYIKHLRDKIDKDFKNEKKLIHTIRGFGYKIE